MPDVYQGGVCSYCAHPILPGEPHEYCDQVLTEIDTAWEEYRDEQHEEESDIYETEICPCGDNHDQHYMGEGHCQRKGCGCPQFGEPPENYVTYNITKVSDGPGPFTVCE